MNSLSYIPPPQVAEHGASETSDQLYKGPEH